MTSLRPDTFNKTAAPLELMTPDTYRATLEQLLAKGAGYGKTQSVGGYLLQDIQLVTETSSGKGETVKNVAVEKLYITMDVKQYPNEYLRNLVIQDIAKKWGGKMIKERDLTAPEFSGPGLWTVKKGAFEFDYIPSAEKSNTWVPNPEAYRVTLTTDKPVRIPVQWGTFDIEAGGTLAIREKDVADLAAALQSIRAGKATAEEALYAKDKDGKTVAKFDIYGMEPGFLEKNYDPVGLKATTLETAARFAAPAPKSRWTPSCKQG